MFGRTYGIKPKPSTYKEHPEDYFVIDFNLSKKRLNNVLNWCGVLLIATLLAISIISL